MAIPIAIVVPRQYQWQYQYQLFSSAISMPMAISIVSFALSQYQCSINQYLSKLININGNVNCSKNTLSIVNGNNNTSKIVNTNGCQYYCSCLFETSFSGGTESRDPESYSDKASPVTGDSLEKPYQILLWPASG